MIDFIYRRIREDIIESYQSGDFANDMDQLNMSLYYLDVHYNSDDFRDMENLVTAKRRLLFKIQASVDEALGRRIYNLGE